MSSISDEIRNWREFEDGTECGGFVTKASFDKLCALADRIDAETVELPKDRGGVPIHVGDTVYLDDGRKGEVTRIGIGMDEDSIYTIVYGDDFSLTPGYLTHTRHDSWERIARDIEEPAFSDCENTRRERREIAERIRRLAERDG